MSRFVDHAFVSPRTTGRSVDPRHPFHAALHVPLRIAPAILALAVSAGCSEDQSAPPPAGPPSPDPLALVGECFSNDPCCRHDAFDIAARALRKAYSPNVVYNTHLVVSGRFDIDLPDPILAEGDVQAAFPVDKVHFSSGDEPETINVLVSVDRFAWRDTGTSRYLARRDLMSDHYADMVPLIEEGHELVMRHHRGTIDLPTYRHGAADIDARFAKLGTGGPLWDWEAGAAEIPGIVPRTAPWYRARGPARAGGSTIADLVPPLMSVKIDLDIRESPCLGFTGPIEPLEVGMRYLIVFRHMVDAGANLYRFPIGSAGSIFAGQETDDLERAIRYVATCLDRDEINPGPNGELWSEALSVCATLGRSALDGEPEGEWTVKRNYLRWRRLEAVDPAFAKLRREGPPLQ